MERLKAILSDKILDLSTESGEEVKKIIDKIQRFRDFANACQALMTKYPQIEDELIKMVEAGDFDTKVASSRVDATIRIAENKLEKETKDQPLNNIASEEESYLVENVEDDLHTFYKPEEVDYEEVEATADEDTEKGYVAYESIVDAEKIQDPSTPSKSEVTEEEQVFEDGSSKKSFRYIILGVGIVIAIVLLIIIVKFVMNYWQTILIVLGVAAVLTILFFWFKKKNG